MPTPRSHGGAELEKLAFNLPAFKGLNTQIQAAILGQEWASKLENTVIDDGSRLAARKGWVRRSNIFSYPFGSQTSVLYEYLQYSGTATVFAVSNSDFVISQSTDAGTTWADATGTATVTDHDMSFVTFNDQLYAWQNNGSVLHYNGTDFEDFTPDAFIPLSGVAISAFGRIWAVDDDGHFLQYCALLDATDWDYADPTSSSGGIELDTVWEGSDKVQALAVFNGGLVVFGSRNILIFSDGQGSDVGMNPQSMYVADTIAGIGCVSKNSVQSVDGDLWFLSDSGLMSLSRLVETRSNPLQNLSYNVQGDILQRIQSTQPENIRSVYSPEEKFYLLSFPSGGDTETGVTYCFDTRTRLEDGSTRCAGVWNVMVPRAVVRTAAGELLVYVAAAADGVGGFTEEYPIGVYSGYEDPKPDPIYETKTYIITYESGWNNYASENYSGSTIKIPKRLRGIVHTTGLCSLVFKVWYDFVLSPRSYPVEISNTLGTSLWSVGEWGTAVWGGGSQPTLASVAGVGGTGEYIKLGLTCVVRGAPVALQELSIYLKQGRLT